MGFIGTSALHVVCVLEIERAYGQGISIGWESLMWFERLWIPDLLLRDSFGIRRSDFK